MKLYDILVAGEINPDLILSGDVAPEFGQVEKLVDTAALTVGSSSAIFACGAARLGLRVAFIGVCGDDLFGRFMLDEMQKRGVDVSNLPRTDQSVRDSHRGRWSPHVPGRGSAQRHVRADVADRGRL